MGKMEVIKLLSFVNFLIVLALVKGEENDQVQVQPTVLVCSHDAFPYGESLKQVELPGRFFPSKNATSFSLVVNELPCSGSEDVVEIPDSTGGKKPTHFYPNGYFRYDMHIYAPDEYCITSISQSYPNGSVIATISSIKIKVCIPDCGIGKRRPCIMKCCPLNQIFRGDRERGKSFCTPAPPGSSLFMPALYLDYNQRVDVLSSVGSHVSSEPGSGMLPHFIINHPRNFINNCEEKVLLPHPTSEMSATLLTQRAGSEDTYHSFMFRIRTDGAIMFKSVESKCEIVKSLDNVCIDGVRGALSDDVESPFNNSELEYILFQCRTVEKDPKMDKYLSFTFGVLLLVTSIFPVMTSIVYLLLWKKQNVHGWTIAATSGCLFFMYIFQGSAHLIGIILHQAALNTFYCRLLGVLIHFFMMSTFTWLTVMSCDLWLTFRSVTPMTNHLHGVSRYIKYSAFGWGVPTIIVLVGIIMDFVTSSSDDCSYYAVPAYGQQSCWIVENALGVYLYYPAAFLLCVNMILFGATCIKLCKYGRGPTIRTRNNDVMSECFSRFTKLFCVMGISWIFEILSWYVDGLGFHWYWNIFDVFNILRAVGVFIIYVCKKDIIMQLETVYPSFRSCIRPFGNLFSRKCSEEMRTDTTVCTGIPPPGSPAVHLKAAQHTIAEENVEMLAIPKEIK